MKGILLGLVLVFLPVLAFAHEEIGYMMNSMGWGMMGFGFWFWILTILGIIWLVKNSLNSSTNKEKTGALEILKERYAKGEIDKKEFEEKKKDLA